MPTGTSHVIVAVCQYGLQLPAVEHITHLSLISNSIWPIESPHDITHMHEHTAHGSHDHRPKQNRPTYWKCGWGVSNEPRTSYLLQTSPKVKPHHGDEPAGHTANAEMRSGGIQ